MQLEDYFDFDPCDRIRIKGTRIPIQVVLEHYLQGISPEEILHKYSPNLSLQQIYATITYYLHNQPEMDAYLKRNRAADEAAYEEHLRREAPEVVKRLLDVRAKQEQAARSKAP